MKIVHICLCGPVTDGWNYQDNMLPKYHKKLGHEVTIITSQWIWGQNGRLEKFEKSNYINSDGVKTIRLSIKGKDNFNNKFKRYEHLYESISNEKPDILFIHNVSFIDINIIVKYLNKNKDKDIKVFVDNHSDYSNSATNWFSKNILHGIVWKNMANKIKHYTNKFYGVTPARVDFLIDLYKLPKEKVSLLVMGADDEKVEEVQDDRLINNLRKDYNIKDTDLLIVTGGKIDEAKTQTLLLMEAINRIKREDVKLIVFGSVEESLKDKFMSLCDNKKVKYIGWVNSSDSYKYFSIADLVVFPGRHSVFWEQVVAQGKPLICKYWEGTDHIDVGGNAKFLYKDTVEEIYKIVISLMENREYYMNMKKIAQTKGKEEFSYKQIARKSIYM
ncbi:glycosyltransferase family 4 protein [Romboutsia sp. CE17]|uniref:glycosyltransferase family 4 protein n=1 Tax=Romboutsia sp. CE17 TaxID=2724150 RepID=UPI001442C126|nr:glycosyltransferase family 4 protein [Romboutsia sp. CE17]QJA09396.1 glycosyltransferase family 4 protein [Romboutsia sp. CE17]